MNMHRDVPRRHATVRNHASMVLTLACTILACVHSIGCHDPSADRPATPGNGGSSADEPVVEPDGGHAEAPVDGAAGAPGNGNAENQADTNSASIQQINELAVSGRTEEALALATQRLIRDPGNAQVLFTAANLEASRGNYQQAVDLVSGISSEHQAFVPALGQSADWLMKLNRYDDAERRYLAVIRFAPTASVAHRRLAQLYNRQGRRQEAASQVRTLCEMGDVMEEELHSLISVPDAFFDGAAENPATDAAIGPVGEARIAFTKGDPTAAEQILRQTSQEQEFRPAGQAFYGRVLVENQSFEDLPAWLSQCGNEEQAFGDFWVAIGGWMLWRDRLSEAADAYTQAIRLVPTDRVAYNRLADCLRRLDQPDAAQWCVNRSDLLFETHELSHEIGISAQGNTDMMRTLAERLEQLHRPLEAVMWSAVATSYQGAPPEAMRQLNEQREQLLASESFPPSVHLPPSMRDSGQPDFGWLADLPRASSGSNNSKSETTQTPRGKAIWANVSEDVGLQSVYLNSTEQNDQIYLLHETTGGGVAVLDYDLDGFPDLYFTQGASKPDLQNLDLWDGQQPNQLYRQRGDRYESITEASFSDDRGYGQGVTAGDFNADGFPDLLIGNIGHNRLLINQGDGTFRDASEDLVDGRGYWTTSVAMADVDGDRLADIIECNYVDDVAVYRDPLEGVSLQPGEPLPQRSISRPGDFPAALDRVFVNVGDGSARPNFLKVNEGQEVCDALAVVVTDIDHQGGNDLFIANDMRANHLWLSDSKLDDVLPLREVGVLAGCAYSGRGEANACMGIAPADFNGDGLLDFAVTNFYLEPMNFFVQKSAASFVDLAAKSGLYTIGYSVNGFGTQPIDYDNNGHVDLVVMNGHIHDARHRGEPFRMLPQLIDGSGERFEVVEVDDPSDYWQTPSLGRAVAKLDWNHDGRTDLVTTHLDLPAGLIENRSETIGNALQLRLVGTDSERDAIGATVRVITGNGERMDTVNTGDGYQCKNEAVVNFGISPDHGVDHIEVTWPTGELQVFRDVVAGHRWMLIEGQSDAVLLHDFVSRDADAIHVAIPGERRPDSR